MDTWTFTQLCPIVVVVVEVLLYVHRNRRRLISGEPGTVTSTFTQLLGSVPLLLLLLKCCFASTKTTRLIRDGKGGMEVGEEGDYIPVATLSPLESLLH